MYESYGSNQPTTSPGLEAMIREPGVARKLYALVVSDAALRDSFAGQAMAAIIAADGDHKESYTSVAATAYRYADAMVRARLRTQVAADLSGLEVPPLDADEPTC